jgi:DNA-binding NtrC family response regulator
VGKEAALLTGLPIGLTLAAIEKLVIGGALCRNKGNRPAAARELGINPRMLFRKLKAPGMKTSK